MAYLWVATKANMFEGAGLSHLAQGIEYLDLRFCNEVTDDDLMKVLPSALKTLVLLRYLDEERITPDNQVLHRSWVTKSITQDGVDALRDHRGVEVVIKQPETKSRATDLVLGI